MELVLAGTPTCAPCKVLKRKLIEEGVDFTYVDAVEDKEFRLKHNIKGTPTTMLFEDSIKDDFALVTIVGFNDNTEESIMELIDLI